MTITGANMNRPLLAQVKPAIVIVEEAAEVGEPHLMSLLGEWVQHLILIGDHKQLRPQVDNYSLVKKFNFDVSMMERLIENNVGYTTLYNQNRMHPDISKLLLDIYPRLQDNHIMVDKHEQINCVANRLFFWSHSDAEKEERSFSNPLEADRAINLAIFMIQQGNNPERITILAPYQGQVRVLRDKLRKATQQWPQLFVEFNLEHENDKKPKRNPIQIQTIDQYQGDENDFIIVSLTRSNHRGNVGFLGVLNRRCVAQSRSRCGLYFIGNVDTVTSKSIWRTMVNHMEANVSEHITVVCPRHPQSTKDAKEASDIPLKESFCRELCFDILPCNKHRCKSFCQPPHKHLTCTFQCEHTCDNNHRCPQGCYPKHAHKCKVEVDFVHTPCGHRALKKCYAKPMFEVCKADVRFNYKDCHHIGRKECWENSDRKICHEPCIKLLRCQHICNMHCGESCNDNSCQTCDELKRKEEEERREMEKKLIQDAKRKAYEELKILQASDSPYEYALLNEDDEHQDEYIQVTKMLRDGIPTGATWEIKIDHVYKITNPDAKKMWCKAKCTATDPTKTVWKFLRKDTGCIESLTKTQFTIEKENGDYGTGIYLSSVPFVPKQLGCISEMQSCLITDTIAGKVKHVEHESIPARKLHLKDLRLRGEGFDSVKTSKVPHRQSQTVDEMAVLKSSSVLPLYRVAYQVMVLDMLAPLEAKALRVGQTLVNKICISAKREVKGNDPEQVQFKIAEATFHRLLGSIKNHNLFTKEGTESARYRITAVDYWINPTLLQRFLCKMDEMAQKQSVDYSEHVLAFHGTKGDTAGIFNNNFDMGKLASGSGDKGFYGAGIYLSEFPQTGLYYGDKLLLCRVLAGKSYDMTPDKIRLAGKLEPGYDSHRVNKQEGGHGEELVIFNPDQVLPVYEIHYTKLD
jgi:hypothetical protein